MARHANLTYLVPLTVLIIFRKRSHEDDIRRQLEVESWLVYFEIRHFNDIKPTIVNDQDLGNWRSVSLQQTIKVVHDAACLISWATVTWTGNLGCFSTLHSSSGQCLDKMSSWISVSFQSVSKALRHFGRISESYLIALMCWTDSQLVQGELYLRET